MTSRCITCKRELSDNQAICLFCGSPQSYLRKFAKSIVVIAIASALIGYGAFEFAGKRAQAQIESAVQQMSQSQIALESEVQDLKQQLNNSNQKIADLGEQLSQEKAKAHLTSEADIEHQNIVTKLTERAKKAEGRASWLGKEVNRSKATINELTATISHLQQQLATANLPQAIESKPSVDSAVQNEDPEQQEAIVTPPTN